MSCAKEALACHELAGFVAKIKDGDIPAPALEIARHCVLDSLSAAGAGFDNPAAAAARKFGEAFFPGDQATVWFDGAGLSPAGGGHGELGGGLDPGPG